MDSITSAFFKWSVLSITLAFLTACGGGGGGDGGSGSGTGGGGSGSGGSGSGGSGSGGSGSGGSGNGSAALNINWDANSDQVLGYIIYYGTSTSQAVSNANNKVSGTLIKTASVSDQSFNPAAPALDIDAVNAPISAATGDQVCFSIVAYNSAGSSVASDGTCIII